MAIENFSYVVETKKSFKDALIAVRKQAESRKWGVLGDYDFSEILSSKGFPQAEQAKSLDLCSPSHANQVMAAEKLAALCMPCSVLVFTDQGKTKIAAVKPGVMLPLLFPHAKGKLGALPQEIDAQLKDILDAAAGS
ncbi:MAG TPA: DUF302 domain-containing protein [Candidatus Bipolaricaulota bacterium]